MVAPILHVITGLGPGGAEAMLSQLAIALAAGGATQHVVSLRDRGVHADALEAAGIPVVALGITSVARAPAAFLRLARLVRKLKPAILQGWMYHGNLAAALAHRATGGTVNRRLIWNLRASNMDAERYARIIGLNARLSSWPELIVANSHAGEHFHLEQGFRPRRIEVIPNGVDIGRFRPDLRDRAAVRAELGIDPEAVVAIHVARVDPMKDHPAFLAAMAEQPQLLGLLVGTDTQALALPANVVALGLRQDVGRLHRAGDIFVSSSAFGEGFSNALAEGMSSGLVPVATDVGDARVIVGNTGPIVPPREPRALGEAIAAVAAMEPLQRRDRGLRARNRIEDRFTLAKAVDKYRRVYGLEGPVGVMDGATLQAGRQE